MEKDKLIEILEELYQEGGKWTKKNQNAVKSISQARSEIQELMLGERKTGGEVLYMALCGRLIRRILEFNPDEHDIELNLCGIIEKAKAQSEKLNGNK